jgi:ribose transport system ATP-binding protein
MAPASDAVANALTTAGRRSGGEPAAELLDVGKRFGATRALEGVTLRLLGGEVHALAGANGAGKSTLIRILSGVVRDYQGTVRLGGAHVRFAGPADALARGVAAIHQELSLVGPMSVTDNLLLAERAAGGSWLRRRERAERARTLVASAGLAVDVEAPVERLSLAERQLVEITRALAARARVLVMDEPTSALGEAEAERLFARIDAMRAAGAAVLFISHRVEELYRLADRITVLRDGRVVASAKAAELGREALLEHMLGETRSPSRASPTRAERAAKTPAADDPPRLEARGVRVPGAAAPVHLRVARGEILGLTGLAGSGVTELVYALFGALPAAGPIALAVDGRAVTVRRPADAIAAGLVLLSGDRGRSVVAPMSVRANASLSIVRRLARAGWVRRERERALVARWAAQVALRCPSLEAPLATLSGGNQQKAALARALACEPRVLLLDDPTRGIDAGAKREAHDRLRALAARGVAVVLCASELDELVALAGRVVVLARGRAVAELAGDALTHGRLLAAVMGGGAGRAAGTGEPA